MGKFIAIIGGGGKTSSLRTLCHGLREQRVLMTTTTHMQSFGPPETRALLYDPGEGELLEALQEPGIICAGARAPRDSIRSLPEELLRKAVMAADWTICEADGAKRLPLKLHRSFEPVIPEYTDDCLIVAGLSAMGRPVSEGIHCYAQNPGWEQDPDRLTGPEEVLYCLRENLAQVSLPKERIHILLNQADAVSFAHIEQILFPLQEEGFDIRCGSLREDSSFLNPWLCP